jgi:hypothetical protein
MGVTAMSGLQLVVYHPPAPEFPFLAVAILPKDGEVSAVISAVPFATAVEAAAHNAAVEHGIATSAT